MQDADLQLLIAHLERELRLPFDRESLEVRGSRAGHLFKLRFGAQPMALKITPARSDEPLSNTLFFYEQLAGAGLPAPRIFASSRGSSIVAEDWLLLQWVESSPTALSGRELGRAIAECMRQIHARAVDGAGAYLDSGWQHPDWKSCIQLNATELRSDLDRLEAPAETHELWNGIVERTLEVAAAQQPGRLLHGDPGPDHVLLHADRVVGIIDPGWCTGGDALFDVAYFLNVCGDKEELKLGFQERYFDGREPGPELHVLRLYQLLGKLRYAASVANWKRFELWSTRLAALIRES